MDSITTTAASRASWKLQTTSESNTIAYTPLHRARQFFAVDASGSTAGNIIRREHDFVERLHASHPNDLAATWGTDCGEPVSDFSDITWAGNRGGTQPSSILSTPKALDAVGQSDLWYLITDGEIWSDDVEKLCRLAMETQVLNVPVVFVITGRKGPAPEDINVSVGISFFANAPDVLILFKESTTGHIYIVAAKGCFASLASNDTLDLSRWEPLKKLTSETAFIQLCRDQDIQIPSADSRPKTTSGSITLGEEWARQNGNMAVDLSLLFTAAGMLPREDLDQLLAEEAFSNLSVACKTRGRIRDLRAFLISQKIEQINIKLEDVSGASNIVAQLGGTEMDCVTRQALQQRLREAHAKNRRHYQDAINRAKESGQDQALRSRNSSINHALEQLAELEKSEYTAEILSRRSNRARRAATVAQGGEISVNSLDIDTPTAFRGECRICYGENEVMSIALKTGADGAANTDNFALDFPLAAGRFESNRQLIASQYVCFQCALAQSDGTRSIFREELAAILPTLDYTGSNKYYIQEQLYVALTGGLRTGASGASQLFMAILAGTLEDKEWAGAGTQVSHDPEVASRRDMFLWMLANMLKNTVCRETFNELGQWVTYGKALAWAAKDFQAQGVDSWAVGYPTAGFMQLLSFGQQTGAFDKQTVSDLRIAKVLHSLASAYLAQLYKNVNTGDQTWKQPLLFTIYDRFHTPLVPIDKRSDGSLVTPIPDFWERLSAFLPADAALLASWDPEDQARLLPRAQLIAFWLVYTQRDHTRAKTFFQNLRTTQPLSTTVLDVRAPLPPAAVTPTLLSIFRAGSPTDYAFAALHHNSATVCPFASPFGPSVLRCGFAACAQPFLPPDQLPKLDEPWTDKHTNALRAARARHLNRAFSVAPDSGGRAPQTGLPVPTTSPAPPTSTHVNLHISVARVWSRISIPTRKTLLHGHMYPKTEQKFVRRVIEEIGKSGRGDVFQEGLRADVTWVLPSFFAAIRKALGDRGVVEEVMPAWVEGEDLALGKAREEARTKWEEAVVAYEIDWEENRVEAKARWEMRVLQGRS